MLYEPPDAEKDNNARHAASFDFDTKVVSHDYQQIPIRNPTIDSIADSLNDGDSGEPVEVQGLSLFPVYLAVFVDFMGFGLILPSIPILALEYGATGIKMGILSASFSLAQMLGSGICGFMSDKYGRKPILCYSLLGSAVSMIGMGLVKTYWALIAVRMADGFMSGTAGTAQAYIADVTPPAERAKRMGLVGAAAGLGVVAGPAIGGVVVDLWHFEGTCFLGAGIALVNFVMGICFIKEPTRRRAKAQTPSLGFVLGTIWKNGTLIAVMTAFFFAQFGFTTFESIYVYYAYERFKIAASEVGWIFAAFGLASMIAQIVFTGPCTKKCGEKMVTMQGSFLRSVSLLLIPYMSEIWQSIACVMGVGISGSLIAPCLSALVSRHSPDHLQGSILGVNQMVGALSRCIAPIVCGWLYELPTAVIFPERSYPFFFGSGAMLLVCCVLLPITNRVKTRRGSTSKSHSKQLIDPVAN